MSGRITAVDAIIDNPNIIYLGAASGGVSKTENGSARWSPHPQWVSNRPFYFQEIAVDPQNENRVWLIYQMIAASEDAGKTFNIVIPL
jgi:hypothetical protein